jgi:hypothetical protein
MGVHSYNFLSEVKKCERRSLGFEETEKTPTDEIYIKLAECKGF